MNIEKEFNDLWNKEGYGDCSDVYTTAYDIEEICKKFIEKGYKLGVKAARNIVEETITTVSVYATSLESKHATICKNNILERIDKWV